MNFLWKCVRSIMAVIGIVLVYLSASTSDYYVLTLKEPEPGFVLPTMLAGAALMLPMIIPIIREYLKEEHDDIY